MLLTKTNEDSTSATKSSFRTSPSSAVVFVSASILSIIPLHKARNSTLAHQEQDLHQHVFIKYSLCYMCMQWLFRSWYGSWLILPVNFICTCQRHCIFHSASWFASWFYLRRDWRVLAYCIHRGTHIPKHLLLTLGRTFIAARYECFSAICLTHLPPPCRRRYWKGHPWSKRLHLSSTLMLVPHLRHFHCQRAVPAWGLEFVKHTHYVTYCFNTNLLQMTIEPHWT